MSAMNSTSHTSNYNQVKLYMCALLQFALAVLIFSSPLVLTFILYLKRSLHD